MAHEQLKNIPRFPNFTQGVKETTPRGLLMLLYLEASWYELNLDRSTRQYSVTKVPNFSTTCKVKLKNGLIERGYKHLSTVTISTFAKHIICFIFGNLSGKYFEAVHF
jgi:hypothetical protein